MYSVYVHLNPVTLKPFYIGKGKNDRWKSANDRSKWWQSYTNKHGFIPVVLIDGLDNQTACEIEKQYIKKYGFLKAGGLLINQTIGGEGGNTFDPVGGKNWNSGKVGVYSSEAIEKMRSYRVGRKHLPGTKEKVLEGLKRGKAVRLSKMYKVICLETGKIWKNRTECMNDLGISIHSVKQMIFIGKKLKYLKN